jgi:RNA polymerase sigma-70 factor (ECF subfamily)
MLHAFDPICATRRRHARRSSFAGKALRGVHHAARVPRSQKSRANVAIGQIRPATETVARGGRRFGEDALGTVATTSQRDGAARSRRPAGAEESWPVASTLDALEHLRRGGISRAVRNAVPAGTKELEGLSSDLLCHALDGEVDALRVTITALTRVVRARALRALSVRARTAHRRDLRQEVEDLTQEILGLFFANDAKVLRAWDSTRGLSLRNFVSLVAEREATRILKSGRLTPWALHPTEDEALWALLPCQSGPEEAFISAQIIARVWARFNAELSPRALVLARRLVVDEEPPTLVSVELGMTLDAIYAWKSRLLKRLRETAVELLAAEASGVDQE